MKKIIVAYWHGTMFKAVGIEHLQEYDYSDEKRDEIIDLALGNNLHIMMHKSKYNELYIWIDNGRFRQR